MTTLLHYQTTELSDEIDPCEKSRLATSADFQHNSIPETLIFRALPPVNPRDKLLSPSNQLNLFDF